MKVTNSNLSRHIRLGLLCIITTGFALLSGCQESTIYERSISLLPPEVENTNPNVPLPEPVDPLEVLATIEKIASNTGLQLYATADDETSLLDIADSDMLDDKNVDYLTVSQFLIPLQRNLYPLH